MSKVTLAVLMLLTPSAALADAYLCVPEAAAMVTNNDKGRIDAYAANIPWAKFVLSDESGALSLKMLGHDSALFDKCVSEFFCERSDGLWAGAFFRTNDGLFGVVWEDRAGDVSRLISAKGKCSKL